MNKLIIYIDGGSRGNPGLAGIGVLFLNEKQEILKQYSEFLGKKTNNEAEYLALIFAFKKIKALFGKDRVKSLEIEIRSDSELLVKQMKGEYKIKDPGIQKLFLEAWNLRIDFKNLKFYLISREQNKQTDKLVNQAIDLQSKTQKLF